MHLQRRARKKTVRVKRTKSSLTANTREGTERLSGLKVGKLQNRLQTRTGTFLERVRREPV